MLYMCAYSTLVITSCCGFLLGPWSSHVHIHSCHSDSFHNRLFMKLFFAWITTVALARWEDMNLQLELCAYAVCIVQQLLLEIKSYFQRQSGPGDGNEATVYGYPILSNENWEGQHWMSIYRSITSCGNIQPCQNIERDIEEPTMKANSYEVHIILYIGGYTPIHFSLHPPSNTHTHTHWNDFSFWQRKGFV